MIDLTIGAIQFHSAIEKYGDLFSPLPIDNGDSIKTEPSYDKHKILNFKGAKKITDFYANRFIRDRKLTITIGTFIGFGHKFTGLKYKTQVR